MAPQGDPFSSSPFKTADYDPEPAREGIRRRITLAAAVTFFAVVAFYLFEAGHAGEGAWGHIKDAMQSVLPAVTSFLGTVLGFYFGSSKKMTMAHVHGPRALSNR